MLSVICFCHSWFLLCVNLAVRAFSICVVFKEERDHQSNNESVLATITPEWRRGAAELLSKMWPDDEIWYFESDPLSWRYLAGRAGYAIVRNGEPVCYTVTKMN